MLLSHESILWSYEVASGLVNELMYLTDDKRDIQNRLFGLLFLEKSTSWSYEDEWRIAWYLGNIDDPIEPDNFILPKEKRIHEIKPDKAIDSIIFGAKMSSDLKVSIYKHLHKKYPNIRFKEAKLSNMIYQIDLEDFVIENYS